MNYLTKDEALQEVLKEVWANPSDQDMRRIAADCAEDCGQPVLAECLRWMADNDKYPDTEPMDAPWSGTCTTWWSEQIHKEDKPQHSLLPTMDCFYPATNHWFSNVQEAEEEAYKCWQEAKQQGWSPP